MNRGPDGPEDVDAAFAEIVAGLEAEGLGSFLTEEEQSSTEPDGGTATGPTTSPSPASGGSAAQSPGIGPSGWRTSDTEWDWASASDEEHYIPPEPPPFPRPKPGTIVGMLLIVVGLLLLIVPTMIGLATRIGTPLGLVCLAAGIGWLVLRIRHGSPRDDPDAHGGRDDGAQL